MDTKPPNGEARHAKDMTADEFEAAKVRAVREAAEERQKAQDKAELEEATARHAKKGAAA